MNYVKSYYKSVSDNANHIVASPQPIATILKYRAGVVELSAERQGHRKTCFTCCFYMLQHYTSAMLQCYIVVGLIIFITSLDRLVNSSATTHRGSKS